MGLGQKFVNIIMVSLLTVASILAMGLFLYFVINNDFIRKDEGRETIGIGIITADEATINKYQAFVEYLNKYSDHQWQLIPMKDYGSFITQLELKQIKAGFMGSAVAYRVTSEGLALPVARGQKDGVSDYYGYIITKKNGDIKTLEDFKGKRFVFVDINTSAGYLFPVYLLKSKGYDPENFFRASSFSGSYPRVIEMVSSGDFDGGAIKDTVWKQMIKEDPKIEKDLQILYTEGPFPDNTFMISPDFGNGEVLELRGLLLKMSESKEGKGYLAKMGIDKFIITVLDDFQVVKKISEF